MILTLLAQTQSDFLKMTSFALHQNRFASTSNRSPLLRVEQGHLGDAARVVADGPKAVDGQTAAQGRQHASAPRPEEKRQANPFYFYSGSVDVVSLDLNR